MPVLTGPGTPRRVTTETPERRFGTSLALFGCEAGGKACLQETLMKRTILTLVFSVATLPVGFAQTQTQSTTEHTQEHSATKVNPDGTAVQSTAKEHERTDSTTNPDGTSSTTKTKQSHRKTKVKSDDGTDQTTTEHHSASSTDTKSTTTPPPYLF
jgi:hypothetical protein